MDNFWIGKISHLVSNEEVIDGKTSKLFNGVVPAKDGQLFYYTVSSTNYYLDEWNGDYFDAPSGRLMVYDPITKKSKVLKEDIFVVILGFCILHFSFETIYRYFDSW